MNNHQHHHHFETDLRMLPLGAAEGSACGTLAATSWRCETGNSAWPSHQYPLHASVTGVDCSSSAPAPIKPLRPRRRSNIVPTVRQQQQRASLLEAYGSWPDGGYASDMNFLLPVVCAPASSASSCKKKSLPLADAVSEASWLPTHLRARCTSAASSQGFAAEAFLTSQQPVAWGDAFENCLAIYQHGRDGASMQQRKPTPGASGKTYAHQEASQPESGSMRDACQAQGAVAATGTEAAAPAADIFSTSLCSLVEETEEDRMEAENWFVQRDWHRQQQFACQGLQGGTVCPICFELGASECMCVAPPLLPPRPATPPTPLPSKPACAGEVDETMHDGGCSSPLLLRRRLPNGRAATAGVAAAGQSSSSSLSSACAHDANASCPESEGDECDDDDAGSVPEKKGAKKKKKRDEDRPYSRSIDKKKGKSICKKDCRAKDLAWNPENGLDDQCAMRRKSIKGKRFPPDVKALLDEALLDRFLNPEDWLCANAPQGMRYMPKCVDLMQRTGLTAQQIRGYMHNNARKGKTMVLRLRMAQGKVHGH